MKILKIELQNINSLKSDVPIVIDFESKLFEDVGLYAITGPTGAGKTTILDAITIAMYHSVPRFNKSNIKAGLEDVVSKGAGFAMSRVTFRCNETKYEATWSMRLESKTGKVLANPQEEIRLKNLTTEKILAEKKREFQQEVESITQLNYQQFLRSAMLAQGEFAAFLSANTKDKGTLLEQITGEEIYKKIGEEIGTKISNEKSRLEQIKAKINTDDLLSDESVNLLKEEQEQLNNTIKQQEKDYKHLEEIIKWFADEKRLNVGLQKLNENQEKLDVEKVENKELIEKLKLHEGAEPFQPLIAELSRIELEIKDKDGNFEKLKVELATNKTNIENAESREKTVKGDYKKQEAEQISWQPKLEKVAELDTTISNLIKLKQKEEEASKNRNEAIAGLKEKTKESALKKQKAETEFNVLEEFLRKNKSILSVKQNLTSWSAGFSQIKSATDLIEQTKRKIGIAENKETKAKVKILDDGNDLKQAEGDLKKLQEGIAILVTAIEELNLSSLLAKQKELTSQKTQTRDLLDLSAMFVDLNKKREVLSKEYSDVEKFKKALVKEITELDPKIRNVEVLLKDAEKILELERNIESFEEERKKLEAHQPCPLCGSKEHPFVLEYDESLLSKSLAGVNERRENLDKLKDAKQQKEIKNASYQQRLDGIKTNLEEIESNIEITGKGFELCESDFKITDNQSIKDKLDSFTNTELKLTEQISKVQSLQAEKDGNDKLLRDKQEKVNAIKNRITGISEELKGLKGTLSDLKTELKLYNDNLERKRTELEPQLSVFDFTLPLIEEMDNFMKKLKERIEEYEQKNEKCSEFKSRIANLQTQISNDSKQLGGKENEEKTAQQEIKKTNDELNENRTKRYTILPLGTSTDVKRKELQETFNKAKEAFDEVSKILHGLGTQKVTKEKEKSNTEIDLAGLQIKLNDDVSILDKQIADGPFVTRKEIEQSLLSQEDKTTYKSIRKRLDNRSIELKTLKDKLIQDLEELQKAKDFELTLEEASEKTNEIASQKELSTQRVGEINEKFKLDQQIRDRNKGVMKEIFLQEEILNKWTKLNALLGGSKHAFNTYVQRLTLQSLIQIANAHLAKLNPRYSLIMKDDYSKGEELNFNLVDHYQTDEIRVVDTSSGGEKFLISLALALGLSDLASKNVNIESLFIDEGFGTLDNNTLETVISTLETLQAQGKMIGVISHVENMKERITSQIQVTKKRNGVSVVEVV